MRACERATQILHPHCLTRPPQAVLATHRASYTSHLCTTSTKRSGKGTHINKAAKAEAPQLCTLRQNLDDCQKAVQRAIVTCETVERSLQKHLQGLERLAKNGGPRHIWLVIESYFEPYGNEYTNCRGAFDDMQDALLRRELLETCPEHTPHNSYSYEYSVVCIPTNSATIEHNISLTDDCLKCPAEACTGTANQDEKLQRL